MDTAPQVSPEAFLEMGRSLLASQPFSRLIGAELAALSPGQCELHVPITDQIRQQHGFVHGGVVSYAADNSHGIRPQDFKSVCFDALDGMALYEIETAADTIRDELMDAAE